MVPHRGALWACLRIGPLTSLAFDYSLNDIAAGRCTAGIDCGLAYKGRAKDVQTRPIRTRLHSYSSSLTMPIRNINLRPFEKDATPQTRLPERPGCGPDINLLFSRSAYKRADPWQLHRSVPSSGTFQSTEGLQYEHGDVSLGAS